MNTMNKFDEFVTLANEAYDNNQDIKALNLFTKALEIKDDIHCYLSATNLYVFNDMNDDAEKLYKKALKLFPLDIYLLSAYYVFLFNKKDDEKAIENFINLLYEHPDDEELYHIFCDKFLDTNESCEVNYQQVISILKKAINTFTETPRFSIKLMSIYHQLDKFKEATSLFNSLLENNDIKIKHFTEYEKFFDDKKHTVSLIEILKKCIKVKSRETYYYQQLIRKYKEIDDLDHVEKTYNQLTKIDPENLNHYYGFASYLLPKNELNKANELYLKAADINYSKVLFEQAVKISHAPYDQYHKAIEIYKQIIKLNPHNMNAYNNMGICYNYLQQFHESLACYTKAIELDPDFDLPYENAANAYRRAGDLKKAIKFYEKALKVDKSNYKVAVNLGITFYSLALYEKAVKYFQMALEYNSYDVLAYYNLALAYNELKKYKEASEATNSALGILEMELNDNARSIQGIEYAIHYTLGVANYNLKNVKEALDNFLKSLEINPNYRDTYAWIGVVYNKMGEISKAKKYLMKSFNMDEDDYIVLEHLGWNAFLEKDYKRAQEYTEKSVEINPENKDGYYNLGEIFMAMKKQTKAKKMFEKSAELGHEEAKKKLKKL